MKRTLLIYAFLLSTLLLSAQTEKQLVPSDLKQQTIVTEPITLRKGYFRPGIAAAYSFVDKYFNSSAKRVYFPESYYGGNYFYMFLFDYGLTDRIQLQLSTELNNTVQVSNKTVYISELDTLVNYNFRTAGRGIGDSYVGIKYQLIPEKEGAPSLAGELNVTIPTGRKNPTNVKNANEFDLPTGNGYFELDFALRTKYISYPYSFTGYATYNYKFAGSRIINATDPNETKFKDGNRLEAGGGINFQMNDWIALANDLNFYHRAKGTVEYTVAQKIDPAWALSYETRLVFQVKRFRIGEGVRFALKGKNVGADPHYVILVSYIF